MKHNYLSYIKNILFPCVFFSGIAGALTGVAIFFFKYLAGQVIDFSEDIYAKVRDNPNFIPILLAGCIVIGLVSTLILSFSKNCRGGGIPTSVAILRGLISFHWIKSVILLPISAMLTYLCGIPLGNEGPSVQMGTAIGKGSVKLFSQKHAAWNLYIMSGGASAGFACATGAPVSGIFFALEEAFRRFSPMLIMVASTAVISGTAVMEILCKAFGMSAKLFGFENFIHLPHEYLWVPLICGIVCGFSAGAFTWLYTAVNKLITETLSKIPFVIKMVLIFVITGVIGLFFKEVLGSGHSLIDELIEGHGIWYMLLLFLLIRLILLIFANNIGVTGGLFIPTLAFGAIIGALISRALVGIGILPEKYFAVVIIVSISAFMSAFVRTPITAVIFSVEALGAFDNILPVIVAVTVSYIIIELMALECFYEKVIHTKVKEETKGKEKSVIDDRFEVKSGAFIIGKEIRDILWPPGCIVLSVRKKGSSSTHSTGLIEEGDTLHIHANTYDEQKTLFELKTILGEN